ncbi:MAG: ABC transporter permease, partial [Clostridia bacterium]|nr:ABC transporter permease [Clostridia bacterium]
LICLCIYFMMRSSVMHRVKEIGVYRAIGVSRKNLVFRFAVETLVLITLSAFVGYLIAAVTIAHLASVSVISSVLYFPWWLALGLFALLYGASVLFGILPVVILTRKTPSAILAKYDI